MTGIGFFDLGGKKLIRLRRCCNRSSISVMPSWLLYFQLACRHLSLRFRVEVAMQHTTKGSSKLVKECRRCPRL